MVVIDGCISTEQELRGNCEPTMFSLEKLLLAAAQDPDLPADLLKIVHTALTEIIDNELADRANISAFDVKVDATNIYSGSEPCHS